jgi:type IV pilus assembly protein PilC
LRVYYMYRFSKLLSQFYMAWISPTVSLSLIANIFENFEYKKKLIEIKNDLASWFTFFESMEWTRLFDPIFVEIMHVWEDTWTLTEVLSRISYFYKNQFQIKLDILMSYIEPLLMVLIAWLVWIIVAAVYLPMVNIVEVL